MITFEKATGLCSLCNPGDAEQLGPRVVVRMVPGGAAAFLADDVLICMRCAETIFEVWKDGRTRYVDTAPALLGMTGQLTKPPRKGGP